jgi:Fic family protein
MLLSRADGTARRFYSMSAQILKQKEEYYSILEKTQKGSTDITDWLVWFLDCLARSIVASEIVVDTVLRKAHIWQKAAHVTLGDAQ